MANGGSKGGVGTSDANASRNDLAHQGKFEIMLSSFLILY